MDRIEELKKGLAELIEEATEIPDLAAKAKDTEILKFGTKYQDWYTKAIKIVEVLAKDRLDEFINYYKIDSKRKQMNAQNYVIQDFIMGIGARTDYLEKPMWDTNNVTALKVFNQLQILKSLNTRVNSIFSDVQGSLLAELQDRELATAKDLIKINLRAAGSLAGVVLENHLQKVMENHKINMIKKNPTISDINDPLKNNDIYDLPTWRKVQYLADIRNMCSHKKDSEPTEEQVNELISGVNDIIKTVF